MGHFDDMMAKTQSLCSYLHSSFGCSCGDYFYCENVLFLVSGKKIKNKRHVRHSEAFKCFHEPRREYIFVLSLSVSL